MALSEGLEHLMEEAAQLAQRTQESQELVSRKLGDWLRETSGEDIPGQMRETEPLVDYGVYGPAIEQEEDEEGLNYE